MFFDGWDALGRILVVAPVAYVALVAMRDFDILGIRRRREGRAMATDLAQLLAGQRERRDPGDRAASTPPDDESLLWHGVFVAETYGPSHVPGLLRSIEKLGWDRAQSQATKDSLRDWILSSRGQAVGGGFWPLTLAREGGTGVDTQVFGGTPLPHGVTFARGLFLTPTPALTVLVLFFAFEDEPASRVEEVLRERTVSEGRRVASGWVIGSVPNDGATPAHERRSWA